MSLLVLILSWGSMGLEAATAVVSAAGWAPGLWDSEGLEAPTPGSWGEVGSNALGPERKDLVPGSQILGFGASFLDPEGLEAGILDI